MDKEETIWEIIVIMSDWHSGNVTEAKKIADSLYENGLRFTKKGEENGRFKTNRIR